MILAGLGDERAGRREVGAASATTAELKAASCGSRMSIEVPLVLMIRISKHPTVR